MYIHGLHEGLGQSVLSGRQIMLKRRADTRLGQDHCRGAWYRPASGLAPDAHGIVREMAIINTFP